jgi:hypothetical protein
MTERKLALAVLVAAVAAAGCGGGGPAAVAGREVRGADFTFVAPSDWQVRHDGRGASAQGPGGSLVSVIVLPLRKPYEPRLFPRVVTELDAIARRLATQLQGQVRASRTLLVAGMRARQYDVAHGAITDRITFVLRDRSEFQLLCRFSGAEPDACEKLIATFRPG